MSNFHFNGRYTLRGINGIWYVYDRDINAIIEGSNTKPCHTFTKAKKQLIEFKLLCGDKV